MSLERPLAPSVTVGAIRRVTRRFGLPLVLGLAAALRFVGLDWDRGGLFHPDERRILMVVEQLHWPQTWDWSLIQSARSPLNPRFFAYGSLPLYLLRLLQAGLRLPAAQLYLAGRALSGIYDLLTIVVAYLLGGRLGGRKVGLVAAGLLAVAVLPIQLAHFATVDTLLVFLCTLALMALVSVAERGSLLAGLAAGILTGLALATKTSALPLVIVGWLAWAQWALRGPSPPRLERGLFGLTLGTAAIPLAFLAAEPYALIDWYRFGTAMAQEMGMAGGWWSVPYTRQYVGAVPYLGPLRQLLLWSLGLPLGLLGLAGILWLTWQAIRERRPAHLVLVSWFWLYFGLVGSSFAQFARYMASLIPVLCLAAGLLLRDLWRWSIPLSLCRKRIGVRVAAIAEGDCPREDRPSPLRCAQRRLCPLPSRGEGGSGGPSAPEHSRGEGVGAMVAAVSGGVVFVASLLYAVAFAGIYLRPHPWLQASAWLCAHVPSGATLTADLWDDALPARTPEGCQTNYTQLWFDPYQPDDEAKLEALLDVLQQADYIVLASQRAYASVGLLAADYPLMSTYYRRLLGGELGFELVYAGTSYPQLGPFALIDEPLGGSGVQVVGLPDAAPLALCLGKADESYSVYDHPRVLIFRKQRTLAPEELRSLLRVP